MRVLLLLLLAWQCLAADFPKHWSRYVDPEAMTLAGVEWGRIAQSAYGVELKSRFSAVLSEAPGLDFVESIDRFVLSASAGKDAANPAVLLILQGRFNLAQLREAAAGHGAQVQRYKNVEMILSAGEGEGMDFAVPDGATLLCGDKRSLVEAIDRVQPGTAGTPAGAIGRRAAQLAATAEIWIVGSPDVFSTGGLDMLRQQMLALGPADPLAGAFLKNLDSAGKHGFFEVALSPSQMPAPLPQPAFKPKVAATAPPLDGKEKIRIYGLEGGTREIDFKD